MPDQDSPTTPPTALPLAVATPAAEIQGVPLDSYAFCFACRYHLAGLPLAGNCPECGHLVRESFRPDLLQFAHRSYLLVLQTGLLYLRAAIGSLVVLITVTIVLVPQLIRFEGPTPLVVFITLFTGVMAILFRGCWILTEPDPSPLELSFSEHGQFIRRILVAQAIVHALLVLNILILNQTITRTVAGSVDALHSLFSASLLVLLLVAAIVAIIHIAEMLSYFRLMARRIPDHNIARTANNYTLILPAISILGAFIFFLGPILALCLYWRLLGQVAAHINSILINGVPARLSGMASSIDSPPGN